MIAVEPETSTSRMEREPVHWYLVQYQVPGTVSVHTQTTVYHTYLLWFIRHQRKLNISIARIKFSDIHINFSDIPYVQNAMHICTTSTNFDEARAEQSTPRICFFALLVGRPSNSLLASFLVVTAKAITGITGNLYNLYIKHLHQIIDSVQYFLI